MADEITHKEVIAGLGTDEKARLLARSDRAGLLHLAGHAGAILITGTIIALKLPLWWLVLPLHGIFLVFLFTLCHECTHQTPFRSRMLNEAVGHLSGALILLPFLWFRYFHLAHHRHTNDPENDPELTSDAKPETWGQYLIHLTGWGYWAGNFATLFSNAMGAMDAPYLPSARHGDMIREARWLLALYSLVLLSLLISPLAFWLWVLPLLLAQPVLRLYLLAEHGRCPPVANMLENSRTTFTTAAIRFLAWNMPYHIEHHSYPNVPFQHLPALHRHMAPYLKSTSPGYMAFTEDYVRHLK